MLWFMKPINHLSRNTASLNWKEGRVRGNEAERGGGLMRFYRHEQSWQSDLVMNMFQENRSDFEGDSEARRVCATAIAGPEHTELKAGLSPLLCSRDGASFCVSESGQLLNSNGWGCCRIEEGHTQGDWRTDHPATEDSKAIRLMEFFLLGFGLTVYSHRFRDERSSG